MRRNEREDGKLSVMERVKLGYAGRYLRNEASVKIWRDWEGVV
jgi:hypothetical protein